MELMKELWAATTKMTSLLFLESRSIGGPQAFGHFERSHTASSGMKLGSE